MLKNIFLLLRPHQWLKNGFVFLPLFFDKRLLDLEYLIPCLIAFVAFSFAASGIYCFNDIYDASSDRMHPSKCKRPIASGKLSKGLGYVIMSCCFLMSMLLVAFGFFPVENGRLFLFEIILFYIILNVGYCTFLKQKAIIDVFTIAVGFVLRILAGGGAAGVFLSHWIILMTFLLALFLALAKRRDDVVIYEKTGVKARKNICGYNIAFMNTAISIIASITMVSYIMYSVSPDVMERFHSSNVYLTSFFVLAGIIRYLQIAIVYIKSGSPTKILMKDKFIQLCICGWLLSFAVILYL